MGKGQTGAIKGFFAIIVLFSHVRGYITLTDSFLDVSFVYVINRIGQLMVTMFFFYSGFGVFKSYKEKQNYAKGFFKNRFLKTILHFDIAVLCYLVLSLIIGVTYETKDYVFAWIGWTSLGNSNWFIFITLLLYLITYLSFLTFERSKRKELLVLIFISILSCASWLALFFAGKENYWFNTFLCYPFGMWFAYFEKRINDLLKEKKAVHYLIIVFSVVSFTLAYLFLARIVQRDAAHSVVSVLFCLMLACLMTKIKIDNPILRWLGKYSFLIYILQRLPMIVLFAIGLSNSVLFVCASTLITICISFLLNMLFERIDKTLFNKKKIN
ncbi:MAG: acyltransferase [Clostridia bacterium]|nr:acyltransferase [Clostridia bacterium]